MQTITTSRNKTFPINGMMVVRRRGAQAQLVIELPQEKDAAEYVADFDGLDSLKLVDDTQAGAYTMYEGFNLLTRMSRADGTVRLTLEKGDKA